MKKIELEKREHWDKIRDEFLKKLPDKTEIIVDSLEEDNKYYHPKAVVNEDFIITTQCDTGTDFVYGFYIVYKGNSYSIDKLALAFDKKFQDFIKSRSKVAERYNALLELIKERKEEMLYSVEEKFLKQKQTNNEIGYLYEIIDELKNLQKV